MPINLIADKWPATELFGWRSQGNQSRIEDIEIKVRTDDPSIGDGLSYPLDQFDVSLVPGEPARLLRVGDLPGDRCGWRIETFTPAADFVGAVVIERMPAWQQQ